VSNFFRKKASIRRFFSAVLLRELSSAGPLFIPLVQLHFFGKIFANIFVAQGAPPVSLSPVANDKIV
jgi:hypothetical protein